MVSVAHKPGSVPCGELPLRRWRSFIWDERHRSPLAAYPGASSGQPSSAPIRGLAPGGVCLSAIVAEREVGSYPAVSSLPEAGVPARAVCFLLHFPRGFPHRVLPGTQPCGARTFLSARTAERPPAPQRQRNSNRTQEIRKPHAHGPGHTSGPATTRPQDLRPQAARTSGLKQRRALPEASLHQTPGTSRIYEPSACASLALRAAAHAPGTLPAAARSRPETARPHHPP